jgi:hypothetical protein
MPIELRTDAPKRINQMKQDLVAINAPAPLALYDRMQTAIAECYAVDDCLQIASQAGAIAAYYKQIKDDGSVRQFLEIKLRAWRRIGEIVSTVDNSGCETTADHIRKIRAAFNGGSGLDDLNETAIRQALKLMKVPREFFDKHVQDTGSIENMVNRFEYVKRKEWEASPEGKAQLRREAASDEKYRLKRKEEEQQQAERQRLTEKQQAERQADATQLVAARDAALEEVGITLDRRDRERMHEIVFLLKKSVHETLRKAAFDNRMTMQAILRAGLRMWLIAHGYEVEANEMTEQNMKERLKRSIEARP